jgi:hypothetical protein
MVTWLVIQHQYSLMNLPKTRFAGEPRAKLEPQFGNGICVKKKPHRSAQRKKEKDEPVPKLIGYALNGPGIARGTVLEQPQMRSFSPCSVFSVSSAVNTLRLRDRNRRA